MPALSIVDPLHPEVHAMIMRHLAHSDEHTPDPDDQHALDPAGLTAPEVTVFGLRDDTGDLIAIGALKHLSHDHVELKSMHTTADRRRSGIGSRVLQSLIAEARGRGYRRISLETGRQAGFAPARRLYERAGFTACSPFTDYVPSTESAFYTRELD